MMIRLPDHSFVMDLPDEWLAEAGMRGFVPTLPAYHAAPNESASLPTMTLPLTSIWLPARAPGIPNFGRQRMVSVLAAIRLNQALPPIEVEAEASGRFSYRLYHGRHRFAASLAMGFTHVPAVIAVYG